MAPPATVLCPVTPRESKARSPQGGVDDGQVINLDPQGIGSCVREIRKQLAEGHRACEDSVNSARWWSDTLTTGMTTAGFYVSKVPPWRVPGLAFAGIGVGLRVASGTGLDLLNETCKAFESDCRNGQLEDLAVQVQSVAGTPTPPDLEAVPSDGKAQIDIGQVGAQVQCKDSANTLRGMVDTGAGLAPIVTNAIVDTKGPGPTIGVGLIVAAADTAKYYVRANANECEEAVALSRADAMYNAQVAVQSPFARTIYFDRNAKELSTASQDVLTEVQEWLNANPTSKIVLAGLTDESGPATVNDRVAIGRAMAARKYLMELGIPPERIMLEGHGEPSGANSGQSSELLRRVECRGIVERLTD